MKTHVKITKLTQLPERPNGDLIAWDQFGGNGSIVEGYWVKGHAVLPPKVGERLTVDRYERNGTKMIGEFSTSPVESVQPNDDRTLVVRTENSVYLVETLP